MKRHKGKDLNGQQMVENATYDLKYHYPRTPSLFVTHTENLLKVIEAQNEIVEAQYKEMERMGAEMHLYQTHNNLLALLGQKLKEEIDEIRQKGDR